MQFLFDTDICIYLIKERPPAVLERFRRHSPSDCAISTITFFELQYGVEKSQYRQRSEAALAKKAEPEERLQRTTQLNYLTASRVPQQ